MNRKFKIKHSLFITLLMLGVLLTACSESAWEKHLTQDEFLNSNLLEAIGQKQELSTFYTMLKKTGYDQVLSSANSFTVFAPTNDAWVGVDTSKTDEIRKMVGMLIVYKTYFTDNADIFKPLKSVNGKNIFYDSATSTFNGAKIISSDIRTSNGAIQITDKIAERKSSIWEYLSASTESSQFKYINSLNKQVLDTEKSVPIAIEPNTGKTKYDTIWKNVNNFLVNYPIDNEDSLYTYIIVDNASFGVLYDKYKPFFKLPTEAKTDSATRYNVCQDFVFKGIVDISRFDTLTNIDGVKVPVSSMSIKTTYNTSNGRVYVVTGANIRLKDKIKPIKIEGENFTAASDANLVFKRYKLWASGERDIAVAGGESQNDTLWRKTTNLKDSVVSKTYFLNSSLVANTANFYVQYQAKVNSTAYDVYYVAYDDIADHFDPTYTNYGVYRIVQKLFISMPQKPVLKWGTTENTRGVANNDMNDPLVSNSTCCFVGEGKAGVRELTKLKKRYFDATTLLLEVPARYPAESEKLQVSNTGTLTMWLCNTARSNTASRQGLLFLDYILLVPRITE